MPIQVQLDALEQMGNVQKFITPENTKEAQFFSSG